MSNMLTLDEVKKYLDVDGDALEKYIRDGKLHAYKIGGEYIRFRKDEVLNLKDEVVAGAMNPLERPSVWSRLRDFWKFNNFYIICALAVVGLVYWFVSTYSSPF